ncbi:VOC family protein [Nocardia sp. NPDC046473]|uniref:VOC family protein n=1 Tax=Nocardia sp. NPDC046473 TaxID=3155733 RepID=UPI0033D8B3DF
MSEDIHRGQTADAKVLALHHVSINVSDIDRALRFYVDVLGLTQRTDRPDNLGVEGAWLDVGDRQIHLIEHPDIPPALGQHFALLVDKLDLTVSALRSQGLTVSDPVQIGRGRQSFLSDPDGNVVELHQAPRTTSDPSRQSPRRAPSPPQYPVPAGQRHLPGLFPARGGFC